MKAKINLPNIKGYTQAHYRKVLKQMNWLVPHIKEQAEWRLNKVKEKSLECYKTDKCVHCGCEVSSKVFEDRACEGNCYPKMMTEEQWKQLNTHPHLTRDELLEVNAEPTLDVDLPGKEGTQFKIKLNKDQFSGNMSKEQIEDIAKDLGFSKTLDTKIKLD